MRVGAAFVVACIHVGVSVLVPPLVADGSVERAVVATWVLTVLPGVVMLSGSAAARQTWWRWPLLWGLSYAAWADWAVVILLCGGTWVIYQWFRQVVHAEETTWAGRPGYVRGQWSTSTPRTTA